MTDILSGAFPEPGSKSMASFDRLDAALAKVPRKTREQAIKQMESSGLLDPDCTFCQREIYARTDVMPYNVFCPSHKASSRCQSGKRAHCTCDTCF